MTEQIEVSTWADADVVPGPGNPAHPDHEAWLAQQTQDDEQANESETEQKPK